jgi:hypothetical protein
MKRFVFQCAWCGQEAGFVATSRKRAWWDATDEGWTNGRTNSKCYCTKGCRDNEALLHKGCFVGIDYTVWYLNGKNDFELNWARTRIHEALRQARMERLAKTPS